MACEHGNPQKRPVYDPHRSQEDSSQVLVTHWCAQGRFRGSIPQHCLEIAPNGPDLAFAPGGKEASRP